MVAVKKIEDTERFLAPDKVVIEKEVPKKENKPAQPRILAIAAKNRKGKIMLAECEDRGIKFVTVIEADLDKNVLKTVQDIIKSETGKDNKYDVAYISVSNTDINRDPEYLKLRGIQGISVNLYFDGSEDTELANKAYKYKIE